ncbi:hypothetical protein F2Q69_00001939 [Brassica cretica]|uniref:Uncharacterized protein n=1 Tax=Brassica cretica TaxID=69181 RepID=A0A8S9NUB2_BRACR|nr:hypothetical protein F2Q69_00001939 [Brassica cretica]
MATSFQPVGFFTAGGKRDEVRACCQIDDRGAAYAVPGSRKTLKNKPVGSSFLHTAPHRWELRRLCFWLSKTFPTLDRRTWKVIVNVAEGDTEDINQAVKAARKAIYADLGQR